MATSLAGIFHVLFLLLVTTHCALCLQCYSCTDSRLGSENKFTDWILDTFNLLNNDDCKMEDENDKYRVPVRNCPKPKSGHIYKCAKIEGKVNGAVSKDLPIVGEVSLDITYHTIERDCIEVPLNDPDYTNGCHDSLPLSGPARFLLESTIGKGDEKVGDMEFNGKACYDRDSVDVPKGAIQCPRCTWSNFETSNEAVQWLADGLGLLRSDHCLFNNEDVDKYQVDYVNCPQGGKGEQAKCGDINGEISGSVLGVDINYSTLARDCVIVPVEGPQASAYKDGCHDDVPADGVAEKLVQESYSGIQKMSGGNVNFKGHACYSRTFDAKLYQTAGAPAGATWMNIVVSTTLLIVVNKFVGGL